MNAPREQQLTFALRRNRDGTVRTSPAAIREAMAAVRGTGFRPGDERQHRIYAALFWELVLLTAVSDEEVMRGEGRR